MKRLAIAGTGTITRDNAPWKDTTFDIWVLNEAPTADWCKRYDAVFQMHPEHSYTGPNRIYPQHWEWLQQAHGKPVYMQAADSRVPDSVAYPLQDAIDLVGLKYLTATVCYMLALAKLQGYERIDIYGIEMSMTEYQYQAECYRFWIGYLKGAGIEINLCSGQPLFDSLLYGYEGAIGFGTTYYGERVTALDKEWNLAEQHAKACKRDVEKVLAQDKTLQLPTAVLKYYEAAMRLGEYAGALAEAERYAALGESNDDRGAFEHHAALAQKDGNADYIRFYTLLGKVEYVGNVWAQTKSPQAKAQVGQFIEALTRQAELVGAWKGKHAENIRYVLKYDAHAKAMGVTNSSTRAIAEQDMGRLMAA